MRLRSIELFKVFVALKRRRGYNLYQSGHRLKAGMKGTVLNYEGT